MAFIPVGYAEATMSWKVATATEPILNVIGLANPDDLAADELASNVGAAVLAQIAPIFDANISLDTVRVITEAGGDYTAIFSYPGELTYPLASPNVTHLIQKNTGVAGRANRGRMYLPGVDESDVNAGGFIAEDRQVAVTSAVNDFLSDLDGAGSPMVVLHNPPHISSIPVPVVSLTCQAKVATQRRRVR